MIQLPALTQTGLPGVKRIVLLIGILIYNATAMAHANTPTLQPRTANKPACAYQFTNLTPGGSIDRGVFMGIDGSNQVSFTAQLVNDKAWLAWSVSHEVNVSHYTIERSYDNKSFHEAAILFTADDATTINNYSYKDPIKNAAAAVIYYRLKMVDKDGKYKYSETKTVRLVNGIDSPRIAVYPNPVANELHISLPAGWQNKMVNGQLLSAGGSIVKSFNIIQSITIGLTDIPPGTYHIKVVNGNEISTQTIVK